MLKLTDSTYKLKGHTWINCLCSCGKYKWIRKDRLLTGATKSCGCLRSSSAIYRFTTHGTSNSTLYAVWRNMKSRCLNKNTSQFSYYGERGISICDDWHKSFISFYKWAINNNYSDGLEIDRIDNNMGYSPDNCRFVTTKVNAWNKRNVVQPSIRAEILDSYTLGKVSMSKLAKIYKVSSSTIFNIVHNKYTVPQELSEK